MVLGLGWKADSTWRQKLREMNFSGGLLVFVTVFILKITALLLLLLIRICSGRSAVGLRYVC